MRMYRVCALGLIGAILLTAGALIKKLTPEPEQKLMLSSMQYEDGSLSKDNTVAVKPENIEYENNENEKIKVALLEEGYYHDDIPLSYEEQDYLQTACDEFEIEYSLMLGLIDVETNFRNVTGDNGNSEGYCQIQKRWWSDLMIEIGATDLMNPQDNFRTSCAILSGFMQEHTIEESLTCYNTGSFGRSHYANNVLEKAEYYKNLLDN